MNVPLVSILVLTYNHEQYIGDCLNSILMQQVNFPIEILVGDDCSTDNTSKIVSNYQKCYPYIKLYKPEHNLFSCGKSVTTEILIPEAQGKYVAFCEGDDFWLTGDKLQRQVDFLEAQSDYAMCFHDHIVVGDNQLKRLMYKKDCDACLSETLNLNKYQTATIVGHKSALENEAYSSYWQHPLHCYGDINILCAFFAKGKVRHLSGEWSAYRRHEESVTASDEHNKISHNKHIGGLTALRDCYGDICKNLKRNYRSIQYISRSSTLIRQRRFLSAMGLKVAALVCSPMFVTRMYLTKYF